MKSAIVKNIKAVALAIWFLFSVVWVGVPSLLGSATPNIDKADSTDRAALYENHCASCHGPDGRAKTSKGKRSGATDLTSDWNRDEARGVRIITNGKGEMPSFKRKLSSQEIRELLSHVLNFKH